MVRNSCNCNNRRKSVCGNNRDSTDGYKRKDKKCCNGGYGNTYGYDKCGQYGSSFGCNCINGVIPIVNIISTPTPTPG